VEVEKPVVVKEEVIKEVPVEKVVEVEKVVDRVVTPTARPIEKATVSYEDTHGLVDGGIWDEMGPIFSEMHPNITVNAGVSPEGNHWDKLLARFVAGTMPDIYVGWNQQLPIAWEKGQTLDLRPYVERDLTEKELADFHPKQLKHFQRPEAWFAMPYYMGVGALVWNVDIFDELGLDRPEKHWKEAWSYDEWFEVLSKIVKDEGEKRVRWGAQVPGWHRPTLLDFIAPWGATIINPDDNRDCTLGEPPAQEGLEWVRAAMWDHNVLPTSGQYGEESPFYGQRVGMVRTGPWATDSISRSATFKWNLAPYPQHSMQSTTLTTDGFAIFSKTKSPDASWEVLKFLETEEYERAMVRYGFLQPARKSVLPYFYDEARKAFAAVEEYNVDLWIYGEPVDIDIGHTYPYWAKHGESEELLQPVLDKVFRVGDTPVTALIDVCEKIDKVNGL